MKLYLASNNRAIGALLAQDDFEGVEQPVYYVSRLLKDTESRYPKAKRLCLALVYTGQRLRHYMLSDRIELMTKTHPVRYMLTQPVLSKRMTNWLLQFSEYDISCNVPRVIGWQAIVDVIVNFPSLDDMDLSEEIPGDIGEIAYAKPVDEEFWTMHFDGSSTSSDNGAEVVLFSNSGHTTTLSFKLDFSCSNNVAEYEAYTLGLSIAKF